ncbi:MAG TPA: hypothetical protein PLM52_09940, partial [Tabrizicola sp.]|nr:hypothetical protein [Tabrizicola sp.]
VRERDEACGGDEKGERGQKGEATVHAAHIAVLAGGCTPAPPGSQGRADRVIGREPAGSAADSRW